MDSGEWIALFAVLFPMGLAGIYAEWRRRRLVNDEGDSMVADAATSVVGAAMSLLEPLRDDLRQQAEDLERQSGEIEVLTNRVRVTEGHVSVLWAVVRDARPPTRRLRDRMPDDPDVAELHDLLITDLDGWSPKWPPDLNDDL